MSWNFWLYHRRNKWFPLIMPFAPKVQDMMVDVLENQEQYNELLVLTQLDPSLHAPLKEVLTATAFILTEKMSKVSSWKTKEVDVRHYRHGFIFSLKITDYIDVDYNKRVLLCRALADEIWKRLASMVTTGSSYTFYNMVITGSTFGISVKENK